MLRSLYEAEGIVSKQGQIIQTPRRDIKIASLRGKEAREVWKALGRYELVYNDVKDSRSVRTDMYRYDGK
jgi:hypothetical protein